MYKAVRSKARQAKRWKLATPVVICIGSSLSTSLWNGPAWGEPGPKKAVLAALCDPSGWDHATRYRLLEDAPGRRYRVSGSRRISAVTIVSIESEMSTSRHTRGARVDTLVNEDAQYPLTESQLGFLRSLDFNSMPYGPQHEVWDISSRRESRDVSRAVNREHVGKMVVIREIADGWELDIPLQDFQRLLTGELTLNELADRYGKEFVSLTRRYREIEQAEVVAGNAKNREASVLRLRLREPEEPVVQRPRRRPKRS